MPSPSPEVLVWSTGWPRIHTLLPHQCWGHKPLRLVPGSVTVASLQRAAQRLTRQLPRGCLTGCHLGVFLEAIRLDWSSVSHLVCADSVSVLFCRSVSQTSVVLVLVLEFFVCFSGWPGIRYIEQAAFRLRAAYLLLLPQCWHWRHAPPCPAITRVRRINANKLGSATCPRYDNLRNSQS